jgi:CRP/FNR family transcriptional regulator
MLTEYAKDWSSESNPIKEVDQARCIEKLKKIGKIRSYPKGGVVSRPGDSGEVCFVVLSGMITAQVIAEDGAENHYISHKAGNVLLDAQCLCEWTETAEFYAAEPSELIAIGRVNLLAAMEKDFEIALFFMGTLSRKFRWYVEHCRNLSMYSAMRRFCDLLLEMADNYGEKNGQELRLRKKVSQEELAKQLHVNRLTVIRCIKELREQGLVGSADGYICIRDLSALKVFKNRV